MVFGISHTVKIFKNLEITKITINDAGEQTEFIDEVLSLGVILGRTLSWEPQINPKKLINHYSV